MRPLLLKIQRTLSLLGKIYPLKVKLTMWGRLELSVIIAVAPGISVTTVVWKEDLVTSNLAVRQLATQQGALLHAATGVTPPITRRKTVLFLIG